MEIYILVQERLFQKEIIKAYKSYDAALKDAGKLAIQGNSNKNYLQRYSYSIVTINLD